MQFQAMDETHKKNWRYGNDPGRSIASTAIYRVDDSNF